MCWLVFLEVEPVKRAEQRDGGQKAMFVVNLVKNTKVQISTVCSSVVLLLQVIFHLVG